MEKKLYELEIDPEFEKIAPPLSDSENKILSENILRYGCRSPLVVWNGVIVDGHNRYRICHENNIPFTYEETSFADREEAKLWIVNNQLGRRNLTSYGKFEIVFPYEAELKEQAEQRRREAISRSRTGANLPPSEEPDHQKTRDFIGQMIGMSARMVDMARVVYRDADEATKTALRKGDKKISGVYKSLSGKKQKEKSFAEAQKSEDAPDIVAAYLEKPLPFEPVQQDDEDDGLSDFLNCLDDALDIIRSSKAEDRKELKKRLDSFYKSATRLLNGNEEQL